MNLYRIESIGTKTGHVGPGGVKCRCCQPVPYRLLKPFSHRAVRRVMKQKLPKECYDKEAA